MRSYFFGPEASTAWNLERVRAGTKGGYTHYNADIRESASVAHLYGQNLVAAESLTAGSGAWAWSPQTLKPTADKELAMDVLRYGADVEVIGPKTLREEVARRLKTAAQRY